jgi:hypothetical protein
MRGRTERGKTVGERGRDEWKMQNRSGKAAHIPRWIHSAKAELKKDGSRELFGTT